MMIRPRPARWFELLVARDDTTLALEALAATGAVELEARSASCLPPAFAELRALLQRYGELAQRYHAYWPAEGLQASRVPEPPVVSLRRCVERLEAWALAAEPLIRRLQDASAEASDLVHWQQVIEHVDDRVFDLSLAAAAGPSLQVRLAVLPATPAAAVPDAVVVLAFEGEGALHALAVGSPAQLQLLAQLAAAAKGRWLVPPAWLTRDRAQNEAALAARHLVLQQVAAALRERIAALAAVHGLHQALADAQRLQWVIDNVHGLEAGDWFCWITGWTSADDALLEAAVDASGVRALLRLPPRAPETVRAPLLFANPPWARPFEVFARALGMPSGTEADPSVLLAIAVPLMFGYMFGDVGQGLVIAAAGFFLRRRFPLARLFIAGGLSATLFGFVFGSVFSLHRMQAWWVRPLDDPLAVLVAPLIGGALLLSLGLVLAALEAHWRGELARWMATEAGLLAAYLALVVAPLWPPALGVAAAGVLLFCLGHAALERHATAAFAALGEAAERLLQILINTLSFARVGAFALAHAGLSSAIVALMDAAPSALLAGLVLLVGNLVVIVLEGLVVSIQTTRLVLFEFFTRFLQGQGRVFRPLQRPPSSWKET